MTGLSSLLDLSVSQVKLVYASYTLLWISNPIMKANLL